MSDLISSDSGLTRRESLQWMAAVAAALSMPVSAANLAGPTGAMGYGNDPDLLNPEFQAWPKVLTAEQVKVVSRLIDQVLPARGDSPSASGLGLAHFFEEWLSAPYPTQRADLLAIEPMIDYVLGGGSLIELQSIGAREEGLSAAWERFRLLTAAAYYTTPIGMGEMGFVGNVPQTEFKGPPAEALALLDRRYEALD